MASAWSVSRRLIAHCYLVAFVALYAEVLFIRYDGDGDGLLTPAEAQAALQWMVPAPEAAAADGSGVSCRNEPEVKPQTQSVHIAWPVHGATHAPSGELRLARGWFWRLFCSMA